MQAIRDSTPIVRNSFAMLAASATLLFLALTSCDSATSSDATPPSRIFVADSGHAAIVTVADSNPSTGALAIDRIISGSNTGLSMALRGLALDAAHDRLYAAVENSAYAFRDVGTANGNVTSRLVSGATSDFDCSVFLDTTNDRLYLTSLTGSIRVINDASSANTAAPSRTIVVDVGDSPITSAAAVDARRDILYVLVSSNSPSYLVAVFDVASRQSGKASPNRTFVLNQQVSNGSLYLDETNDRLYVSGVDGSIGIYEAAHTRSGSAPADRLMSLYATNLKITVDTVNDRLYGVSGNFVFAINDISTVDDSTASIRLTAPAGSNLTAIAVDP